MTLKEKAHSYKKKELEWPKSIRIDENNISRSIFDIEFIICWFLNGDLLKRFIHKLTH